MPGPSAPPGARSRPNILFLLSDDQRADALGCAGNPVVLTPNLDRLAASGTRFREHFVTTAICCVSRASILSGQYQRRHGIDDFHKNFSPAAFSNTYPVLLREHGYRVGFIGKWGVADTSPPPAKAFDFWAGFNGQGRYFATNRAEHLTELMQRQAVEFLRAQPADRPFCLAVSFKAPHAQDNAPREFPPDPRDELLYVDAVIPPPESARAAAFERLPEFLRTSEGRVRWERRFATPAMAERTVRDYYRLVTGLDRAVGGILATLHERGLDENTLIVFTSDNGFSFGEHGLADKWFLFEESIRTPLLVRFPPAAKRPTLPTVDVMTLNIDLAPTLLDYAGVPVPAAMQGRSLRPLLEGQPVAWRTDWFYEHHFTRTNALIPPSEGVRTGRWKYVRYLAVEPVVEELYDLANDPHEAHNLAGDPAASPQLAQLRRRWAEFRRELR